MYIVEEIHVDKSQSNGLADTEYIQNEQYVQSTKKGGEKFVRMNRSSIPLSEQSKTSKNMFEMEPKENQASGGAKEDLRNRLSKEFDSEPLKGTRPLAKSLGYYTRQTGYLPYEYIKYTDNQMTHELDIQVRIIQIFL